MVVGGVALAVAVGVVIPLTADYSVGRDLAEPPDGIVAAGAGGGLALDDVGLFADAPERIAAVAHLVEGLSVVAGCKLARLAERVGVEVGGEASKA